MIELISISTGQGFDSKSLWELNISRKEKPTSHKLTDYERESDVEEDGGVRYGKATWS